MNCAGCGVELDPTNEQVNVAVDQILETSLKDAERKGGVCPLCGHSKQTPPSQRKAVQFALLVACLVAAIGVAASILISRQTKRSAVANEVLQRLNENQIVVELLGQPVKLGKPVQGEVKEDETGWSEARLTMPVIGPKGTATVQVVGGRGTGPWVFTTLEAVVEAQRKKADLVTGTIVEYDPAVYVDVHTQAVAAPEYLIVSAAAPTMSGEFPCVFAALSTRGDSPELGQCGVALPMTAAAPVDLYQVDLRYGSFLVRQTDLLLRDAMNVPLTRSYNSQDWIHPNPVHAFGNSANHDFDFTPLGTRNPYTYQLIALGDGNFLYFDRISKGGGYRDAVFQHTETSTSFYKAITRWNSRGWVTRLDDGSTILFPESYNAKNMAQGAAWEVIDRKGNKLKLVRDGKRDLREVLAPEGGSIKFKYDDQSRIVHAEDSGRHWANYRYNPDGMLTDVALSSGVERHYTYAGHLMTSIHDERGRILVQNYYTKYYNVSVLDHQQTEAGTYAYQYEFAPNREYVVRAVVTFPDGSTKTIEPGNSVPGFVKRL